ncbi:hypothetical protein ACPUVO_00625 [Pseudocolwellia sp. HL-MZ19]|uniref:hypothetical protein n=1 Tax=Pseudocolwellia sp. HL-MZ19 TaxID=3400846 RepID=UPI003CEBBB9C
MALLLDNDIVHKLAQLDMLDDAINVLNVDYGDIFVLDTMRFKYCSPSNSSKRANQNSKYGAEVVIRIERFITKVKLISDQVTDTDLIEAIR